MARLLGILKAWLLSECLPQQPLKTDSLASEDRFAAQLMPRLLPGGSGTFRVFSAELVVTEGVPATSLTDASFSNPEPVGGFFMKFAS